MIKVSVQNIVGILLGDCLFLLRNSLFGVYIFIYIKFYIIKYYIELYIENYSIIIYYIIYIIFKL